MDIPAELLVPHIWLIDHYLDAEFKHDIIQDIMIQTGAERLEEPEPESPGTPNEWQLG